jgi:SAM-dependent methyltransferase
MGLIQSIQERLRVVRSVAGTVQDNRKFKAANPDFPLPPYALAFDAYGHTSWPGYLRHGLEHADLIAEKVREFHSGSQDNAERPVILDWGCGPGRVIRQLAGRLAPLEPEIHGADYNPKTIRWCRKNLAGIHFERNGAWPPMPFADRQFDVIYGISVFTHLSEKQHFAWRDELVRLLAPGGLLIITLHGERFVQHLDPQSQASFRNSELVVLARDVEGKREFQAFHPQQWVQKNFAGPLECLQHDERELFDWFHQDIWVLRKPAADG